VPPTFVSIRSRFAAVFFAMDPPTGGRCNT
jgi:hypothetical protein